MADRAELTIDARAFAAALSQLGQSLDSPTMAAALLAGVLPIVNEAKRLAPVKTGDYRRSIHAEKGATNLEVLIGTDKPQGARLEFGFNDTDKLGRRYHQPARPHFRPALTTKAAEAEQAIGVALQAMLEKQIGQGSTRP